MRLNSTKTRNLGLLLVSFILLFSSSSFAQLTVTKTYVAPSSVSIDGCGTYCASLPGVTFSAADFTNGNCQITDVNVSITWAKTDGTCLAPLTGSSFHNETNFRIDGPTGNNVILVQPNSYTGNGSTSTTTTVLDQAAATVIGGVDPVSGTFRPNNGNLNTYNGTNAHGTWFLRAGDLGGGDPLCIVGYSVTITVSADNTAPVPVLATLPDINAACSVTSLTAPTATDNCSGAVTGTPNVTLPITTQGTTVITWTYTDGSGNSSTQTQNVIIDDVTAPVPNAASLSNVTGECAVASITAPTATDNCIGPVTGTTVTTFPITTQGTTVVTWTFNDGNGNISTQTQNVIVDDITPPVPGLATLPNVTAQCSVTSLTTPTVTDNCPGLITVTNNATLPITTQGTTVVTWTYDDGRGNTTTQTQNVVINDNTGPTPALLSLPNVTAECEVTSLTTPTAIDNCGGTVTYTNDATLPITAQGTTLIVWTYTDAIGNIATQSQNIIIDDVTAPVPTVATLPDVTDPCSVNSLTAPTATDNCGGAVTVTNNATLPITAQGTTVVTWTYNDGNGNTSTQTQNVIITDVTAPVPDAPTLADINAVCSVTTLTAPTATDNCGGVVTVTNNASLPITTQGTTVVTWTYTDGAGNSSTQTQNVILTDVTAPVPDSPTLADVTAECSLTTLTAPTATDNCAGVVTVTNNATLPIASQGTTVVTWTYTDAAGNSSTQTQNVVIDDVTAPAAAAPVLADVTAECSVNLLTSPSATDNCGGLVTVTNNATLPITTQGTTVVTWTYNDGNGNTSTQTQNVVIDDVTAPVPNAATLANVTAECSVASLTAPTATDNCGGLVIVTNNATLPISSQGTTVITWTYDDGNGNTSTQTQNVVIDDVTAPVPTLATLADVTAECTVATLTAPTATDNCGGVVTVTNNATLPITAQGTTVVTWTYDDGNGNTSTQTQNVVIDDVTAPVPSVATLADVTAECSVTALAPPTATDNCGGVVTVTNNATLPITAQGTTVVTWTYDDGNGNTSTQTQNVVIDDVTAPVADLATLADVTAECTVTTLTAPTATDNCGGVVTVTNNATLPITAQGTTVVTWTYDDGNGNTSTQTQNVVIDDLTAPVPTLATLADVTASCTVTSLTAPTATDNCGGVVTVTNNATLPITTQGTTVVTWTYTDVNGNSSTQTQNVIILDVIAPVPDLATLANVTAECTVASLTAPTATDNCGGAVTVTNNAILPITAQGTTVVTWTYTDLAGNSSTQTQNVILDDVTAPVPMLATLANVTAECTVTSLTAPTATDNCGGVVTVTNNATLPISAQGTTVVTWTYDDGNGNTSTQTQNVVIDDVTAPVPTLATLANVTAECSVTSLTAPTATDNCGGLVTVTNNAALPITAQGTTVVTWTYDDGNGNTSTQTQNVVIDDVTAPVPTLATLANVTAECSVTSLTAPTATDNCGGVVTVTNNATLPITAQGTTVVTWTYDDGNGNTSTQTQNVVIDDVTAPVPTLATLANVTAECSVTTLTAPTATDNCGGVVTVTNNATLPITAQGTTVVTWTYDDGNGNTSTQTQNVVIDDVTAPVPTLTTLANVTAECSVTSLTAPTATDNCGGVVTVTNNATLPITAQGTTVVTWTYNDGNGNTSTQTQNVIVDDVTAPVPNAATLANVTAECSVTSLTAPTATDNCGGVVTVTNNVTLPITTQGTTVVTWTYNDGNGNTSTQTQNVIIDDVTAPVPTLASLANVTAECSVTSLTAPTATDNCGGLVTVTNNATLPITVQGTTVVIWTYDDGNGNTSTQTQNVVIDDVTAPVPTVATLANVTAECTVSSLTAPTATDNCGGVVTVTNNATLPIITQGTTAVTWTYDDGNGNTSTQTQNVVIDDVTAPVPTLATLANVTAECSVNSLIAPTATDNCGGVVTVTNNATLPITAQGTTVVTWTYDDGNGNTSTQTQNVVIDDVTAPVPTLATLANVTAECTVASLTAPTATDNCGGVVTVTNNATLPITAQGTTVVTWTYNDGNGNTSTQTQNVVIDDVTAPVPTLATLANITAECTVNSLIAPTATDNCGGVVTVTNNATLPITTQGTTVVTWTYNDGNGNTTTQTQNVVIDDVTAPVPVIATLANITAQCSVTSLTAPSATDNCGGVVMVTNNATLPITTQGTTVVTWTYDDGNGNTTTQTQNVVIDDITAPVPTLATLPTITAECGIAGMNPPTATDNCLGLMFGTTTDPTSYSAQGTYTVTWTFNDGNGNSINQTQSVVIDDVSAPLVVNPLPTVTAECSATLTAPIVNDVCVGPVTGTTTTVFPITTQGTTVVTWTYDDGLGNTSTQTQLVVVDDVTAPVPNAATLANVTATCSLSSLTPPTATDNCGGTVTVTNDALLPITAVGTTVVTWTYTDVNGNSSTQNQNVIIVDVTGPVADVATLPTIIGQCSAVLTAPTATDACDGITVSGTTSDPLSYSAQGTYTVTWTYTDANGNTTTQNQTVIIDDVNGPVANTATLSPITAICSVTPIAPIATDNCEGVIVGTTTTTFPITASTVITWSYADGNGNITTQLQTVTITGVDVSTTLGPDGVEITANNSNGDSYQWIDCATGDPVADGTNQSYFATSNGSYAVIINEDGCIDTSACVTVVSAGIEDLSLEFTIFPNPTVDGSFTVQMDAEIARIELIDMLGRFVTELASNNGLVDVSSVEMGKYFVKITTTDERVVLAPIVVAN